MTAEEKEYIRYRLGRAEEACEEAELLLQKEHVNTAVNRLYYACFYAVSALLYSEGLSSSKHQGVRSLFDRHWIKTGRLPAEMGRFYHQLFERRQRGDYGDLVTFDRDDVANWLKEAGAFVARISERIQELAGSEIVAPPEL